MKKIFVFKKGHIGRDCIVEAIAEDGVHMTSHLSSSVDWAKFDMGCGESKRKHDIYREHFPDGFEVEWVDDPHNHAGFKAAWEPNQNA